MSAVEITICGGAVQDVKKPDGIRVIIRDYDVDDVDDDDWDIRKDEEGHRYQHMEWE